MKLIDIKGEERKALREAFSQVKKDLDPHFNHIKFGDITLKFWVKRISEEKEHCGGRCWKGTWRIKANGRRSWFKNLIILSKGLQDKYGTKCSVDTFKHELVHLIAKDAHGPSFQRFARSCNAQRYWDRKNYEPTIN